MRRGFQGTGIRRGYGAAFTSGFVPPQSGSLSLWLRASDLVLGDGEQVVSWLDQSANSNDATGVAGANRPTYAVAGLNGFPSVLFTAANSQFLSLDVALTIGTPCTLFCVLKKTDSAQGIVPVGQGGSAPCIVYHTDGGLYIVYTNTLVGNIHPNNTSSHYVTIQNQTGAGGYLTRMDGTELTQAGVSGNNTSMESVGKRSTFTQGHIAEMAVYQSLALSGADITTWENYLKAKFGL